MGEETKLCSMCRKSIALGATICPFCRSSTDYQNFIEIPISSINQKRRPAIKFFFYLVSAVIIGLIGLAGIALAGFWVGAGFGLFALYIINAAGDFFGVDGHSKALIPCQSCSHTTEYQWLSDNIMVGKQLYFSCASCKNKTRATITQ